MTWEDLLSSVLLLAGILGHILAFTLLVWMRVWLGNRDNGWPRILLRTLIWCESGYALLFITSLWSTLHWGGQNVKAVVNFIVALLLIVVPWVLIWTLRAWQRSVAPVVLVEGNDGLRRAE